MRCQLYPCQIHSLSLLRSALFPCKIWGTSRQSGQIILHLTSLVRLQGMLTKMIFGTIFGILKIPAKDVTLYGSDLSSVSHTDCRRTEKVRSLQNEVISYRSEPQTQRSIHRDIILTGVPRVPLLQMCSVFDGPSGRENVIASRAS